MPNLKFYISCAGGKSYVQTIQRIGRVLRISPTKKEVFIYDVVDRSHSMLYSQAKTRIKYYKDQQFEIK